MHKRLQEVINMADAETNIRIDCAFAQHLDTVRGLQAYAQHISDIRKAKSKILADNFIARSQRWLEKLSHRARRLYNLHLSDVEDLQNDLVIEIYRVADHFDDSRGVPFNAFIIGMLKYHLVRNDVQSKYVTPLAAYSIDGSLEVEGDDMPGVNTYNAASAVIDKHEISSLEKYKDVFSLTECLNENDRLLIHLRFEMGMEFKHIEELMGVAHGTVWHRMRAVLNKLRDRVKCHQGEVVL